MAPVDPSESLRTLMNRANIASFRALAAQAGVSRWQVQQLRQGRAGHMRLTVLAALATALQISVAKLLSELGWSRETASPLEGSSQLAALQVEYDRLQAQIAQRESAARSQVHTQALQTLEPWLLQWPTVAQRAATHPELPAAKLLPFIKPVESLMEQWGVEKIAAVDSEVPYDPKLHQLIGPSLSAGTPVRVTHSGSRYQGKLLHRAKVKAIEP